MINEHQGNPWGTLIHHWDRGFHTLDPADLKELLRIVPNGRDLESEAIRARYHEMVTHIRWLLEQDAKIKSDLKTDALTQKIHDQDVALREKHQSASVRVATDANAAAETANRVATGSLRAANRNLWIAGIIGALTVAVSVWAGYAAWKGVLEQQNQDLGSAREQKDSAIAIQKQFAALELRVHDLEKLSGGHDSTLKPQSTSPEPQSVPALIAPAKDVIAPGTTNPAPATKDNPAPKGPPPQSTKAEATKAK